MTAMKSNNKEAPFCNIDEASERTGLSGWLIRQNIKDIPHIKSGKKYMIHIDGLMKWALTQAYKEKE